ncbi:hypothetical protein FJ934_07890 [Mesorhizobium sp. B2-4-12]|uniref:WD40/YVTN/BNR-like repeat-containing protein n=1 Tax=unclassified Mesorhizobium TaxID=325217 RepID=UPI00112CA7E8|nr:MULTISPECIES: hypothetical protein [unclassified Mesorhizobium]TPK92440.1 hypothetical protein FJ548_00700 [Mesorhizobium sp. B2-4-17]TPK96872.1 hypothetical protein FJ934_07890 [Mesorhizobium sp. B2-4-12]
MADYSVTVNGTVAADDGTIFSAVAYYDGESFYSFVISESDVASDDNQTERIYEKPCWFTDIWRSGSGRLYVCDDNGMVHSGSGSEWTSSQVSPRHLNTVWGFDDNTVYAGGSEEVVYRWDGARWAAVSPALGNTILCIAGSSPSDLYVSGEGALFWHYDGRQWTQIQLPTNAILVGLLGLSSTDVLVSGSAGTLFRGAGLAWTDVSQRGRDFYKMAFYRKTIHIAGGGQGVFTFDGATVSNLKDGFPVYRLSSNGSYLTVAGGNSAIRYDGSEWVGPDYT